MKLFVDVVKLEAEGIISPQQAVQIRRSAAADTGVLAVNVIAVIGAFAVIAGLLAMRPTSVQVAVIGFGLTIAGALIRKFRQTQLGFLGSSLIVIGAVLLAAGLVLKCSTPGTTGLLFTCPATPKWYGHAVIIPGRRGVAADCRSLGTEWAAGRALRLRPGRRARQQHRLLACKLWPSRARGDRHHRGVRAIGGRGELSIHAGA